MDRTPARAALVLLSSALVACDNWPVQKDAGAGGNEVPPARDAATACFAFAPVQSSASPQVNGGLCFGLALGSSDTLQCGPTTTANVTQCVDALLGNTYLMRWSGNDATVVTAFEGLQIGTVRLITNSMFELSTASGVMATCTFASGPPQSIELCKE